MHVKKDKIAQCKYMFYKKKHETVRALNECIYMEFREALAVLEPLGKKNVVIRDGHNKLWMGRYLFVNKPRSDGTCLLSDYEQFFILRKQGRAMVNNAREEIRRDLAKIVELAKDIKRYEERFMGFRTFEHAIPSYAKMMEDLEETTKECEKITRHNAEILIKLQEVITPHLVARKLSE